jgi:hypothetical protein
MQSPIRRVHLLQQASLNLKRRTGVQQSVLNIERHSWSSAFEPNGRSPKDAAAGTPMLEEGIYKYVDEHVDVDSVPSISFKCERAPI